MNLTRRSMLLGLLGSTCAPLVVQAGKGQMHVQSSGGLAFGSTWRVTVGADMPMALIRQKIEAVIAEVDGQMSPYRLNSDISNFNNTQSQSWQPMPALLCHVAGQALHIANITNGAFDPTLGPVVSRHGFGPIQGGLGLYSDIKAKPLALRKMRGDLTLDLCGIAKGYALDRMATALQQAGVSGALLEVGGEVKAIGHRVDGRRWKVAIADPQGDSSAARYVVAPGSMALATSGHSVNGITGPISTSHIINPALGRPATPTLLSVSVLAPNALEADAFATALCAIGADAGVRLAQELGISALFILGVNRGAREIMTGRFSDYVMI